MRLLQTTTINMVALGLGCLTAQPLWANVIGTDMQNFNPAASASEFVTVQSSSTIQNQLHLGLFLNHASNTLPYQKEGDEDVKKQRNQLMSSDLVISYGFLSRFELGIALPFVVSQQVQDDKSRGEFQEKGNTEVRAQLKGHLLKINQFGLAAAYSLNVNRTSENPHVGISNAPVHNIELIGSWSNYKWATAMNIGYRWRKLGEPIEGALVDPINNAIIASLAWRYNFTEKVALVNELYTSQVQGIVRNETDRDLNSSETIIGLNFEPNKAMSIKPGIGTELGHGLSTPDLRIYAGITYITGAEEKKPLLANKPKKKKRVRKAKKPRMPMAPGIANIPVSNDFMAMPEEPQMPVIPALPTEPAQAIIPAEPPAETLVLRSIHFEFDSDSRVLSGAYAELDKLVQYLKQKGFTKLVIEGHTDSKGSHSYNDDLSFRRSRSVRQYLMGQFNLAEDQMIAIGYGERRPIDTNTTDYGRQMNRRVEIKIYRD